MGSKGNEEGEDGKETSSPRTLRVREERALGSSPGTSLADWVLVELFIDRQNSRGEVDLGMIFG